MRDIPFRFFAPARVWHKAGAPKGQEWRIGGVVSTETPDREHEVVLQQGLDFTDFIKAGWFNDNHSRKTTDILGYPEQVQKFRKGDKLPDGRTAKANCSWVEGHLLPKYPKAREVWQLAQALEDTPRSLSFSVEGTVQQRRGPGGRIVAKARVRNVAVTNAPINDDTNLEVLAKALQAVELDDEEMVKALTMGPASPGTPVPGQTMTGEGAGQVLARESLEHDPDQLRVTDFPATAPRRQGPAKKRKRREKRVDKGLSDAKAVSWVRARYPGVSLATARRVVDLAKAIKNHRGPTATGR